MLRTERVLRAPEAREAPLGGLLSPAMGERVYRGKRDSGGQVRVWFEDLADASDGPPARKSLPLHLEIREHSPTGFAWGYGGSGPAQLALALLVDALGDAELAHQHYQAFKWATVAKWGDNWSISARQIREFVLRNDAPESPRLVARFSSGPVVATPNVLHRVPTHELMSALARHLSGDWGELDEHDWRVNEEALQIGGRLLSAYRASNQEKFWIITEAGRECTTLLLPEDY